MKVYILTFLGILFCSQLLFAQSENASLLAQSPDGRTVKLVWFFKSWSKDITGFDIRRKEGLQDWVKLNSKPIVPEIATKKNLSMVEADGREESRIKSKLYKLVQRKQISEMTDTVFLQKLNAGDQSVRDLVNMMAQDFDIALMSGFAYVDHTVTSKTNYQYGVFIEGTNILLDSVLWNYGQIPDLNAVTEITSRSVIGKNGIRLMWNADMSKMRSGDVAGFNIYREGIRLNSDPVTATGKKDVPEFTWYDKSANSTEPTQYSISAESIFGIEGIIKSYTYNPANHPTTYKKAEVTDINSLGYYFKDGLSVKWNFPADHERFIKGFYIEKDNIPAGYKQVSALLDASARAYVDKSESPATSYIRFRVVAVYHDRTTMPGVEKVYSYFPVREPPQPQNVKVSGAAGDKKYTITISWDKQMNGDSLTDYYNVYALNNENNKYNIISEKPVKATTYSYVVTRGSAAVYKFYVSSIGVGKTESLFSDTVSIEVPSLELPSPALNNITLDSGRAVVRWKYTDIADLRGFRLFQNKVLIAGESELNKNARDFVTPGLAPGNYEFTIRAVSANNILSDWSLPAGVTVPVPGKR